MRVKSSHVFCYSCNERLPRSKFNLLHWNKSQICSECEKIEAKKLSDGIKIARKSAFKERDTTSKNKTVKGDSKAEVHAKAMNAHEEMRLAKQLKEEFGL